jgi:hypothetical protein
VTFARAIKLPDESREAIFVAPYLKYSLPPDSTIEKLVVTKLAAFVAFVAFVAEPAVAAFRLATSVVEVTVNGAVPIATVEVITPDALMVLNAPVLTVVAPTVPLIFIPHVPDALAPVVDGAPTVLYETVVAVPPLNVAPLAAPLPVLLKVRLVLVLTVIAAVPLNEVPLIVLAVANAVAVPALPAISPVTLVPAKEVIHAGFAYDPVVTTPLVTEVAEPVMSIE